jgi:flagellar biosynthetic protein FliQ
MNTSMILSLSKEALLVTIMISAPAVIISLIVGVIVAIFSATTQIQEQTLSFAPKIIFVYLSLIISGATLGGILLNFAKKCFNAF